MSALIKSLHFEKLTFQYEGQEPLLENVDFEFPICKRCVQDNTVEVGSRVSDRRGTVSSHVGVIVIRGAQGTGSSTIMQLLAGLQSPTLGRYLINGLPVEKMSFEEFLPFRLRMGYGFGMGGLISNRSLFENLMLPLNYHKICPPQEAESRVFALMERFQLIKFKDLRIAYVSASLRKLTVLIRAIIMHPEILFLDDPNIRISPEAQQMYAELLRELINNGTLHTIFMASFDESFFSYFDYSNIYLDDRQLFIPKRSYQRTKSVTL
jgi:ABC-type transporter Mla maintaining outer membrane lipid asymmetry ATPase subunit MlaF